MEPTQLSMPTNRLRAFFILTISIAVVCTAHAQHHVSGTITQLRTGWNADSFGIMLDAPQANPAHCTTNNLGYVSSIDQPGYHTYYAAALAAYVAGKRVTVVVHLTECLGPFPKIIGINMP
jgi:hypothetical protein